ncbi:hypothetical protein FHS27_005285 [Rhodopirellula rubra]|uniref:Uncharacterized protein n=1 Tax=Aporhodopirellula rubra TaxID=980271 RepID=A0A7W5E3F4_9BACT|nr:hypothetical protein [Aporhodopirellula rubra]
MKEKVTQPSHPREVKSLLVSYEGVWWMMWAGGVGDGASGVWCLIELWRTEALRVCWCVGLTEGLG